MKTYKFKTNINCGGCIDKVSSYLDNAQDIMHWSVDTGDEDHVLTIIGSDKLEQKDVIDILNLAGFSARSLKKNILSKLFGA